MLLDSSLVSDSHGFFFTTDELVSEGKGVGEFIGRVNGGMRMRKDETGGRGIESIREVSIVKQREQTREFWNDGSLELDRSQVR